MGKKNAFLYLLKILIINFYWICSIMKIYIICCVPTQISYLGKYLFLRYGSKCAQPIRFQDFLINHISRTNWWNNLIFCTLIQIHINYNLIKNLLGVHGQKSIWPVWSRDSKIDCISKMNRSNKLIYCLFIHCIIFFRKA